MADLFKLASELARLQVPKATHICTECDKEVYEPMSRRCTRVLEPETDELFPLLCNGKLIELNTDEA